MFANGVYAAAASPLSAQEVLAEEMAYNAKQGNWAYYHLQIGPEDLNQTGYGIYNLKNLPDGQYEALLVFTADTLPWEDGKGCRPDENGNPYTGVIAFPVKVSREDAWVVTENGETQVYPVSPEVHFDLTQCGSSLLPLLGTYRAVGESGTVTTQVQSVYTVDNTLTNTGGFNFFGNATTFDSTVKPSAEFASCTVNTNSEYVFNGSARERENLESVGLEMVEMNHADSSPEFPDVQLYSNVSGSDNSGVSWSNATILPDWDGTVSCGSGTGWSGNIESSPAALPTGYAARIFWNGEPKETLILKEVVSSGTAAAG
jgi:hypothetical protein